MLVFTFKYKVLLVTIMILLKSATLGAANDLKKPVFADLYLQGCKTVIVLATGIIVVGLGAWKKI